ncbi:MAG: TonB-dependent receptor [Treponema sp.]|nr:TonB-dependent receptor [Treponema sp.]
MKKHFSEVLLLFFHVYFFSEEIDLGHIYTYIENPVAEQREVFLKEDIERSNSESLVSFLASQGFQLLSYGAYGLESKPQIRGFTDETVRVVIDGLCVNNAQYGTFDFTSINIEDIERIEVVRGGFTEGVSDEGSVAGTVYITTKKQSLGTSFNSNIFAKTFFNKNIPLDTISLFAGASHQAGENTFLKFSTRGTFAENKFQYKNYVGRLVERKHSEVKDASLDAKVSHFFGNGSSWSLGNILYAGDKNCPGTATEKKTGVQRDLNSMLTFSLVNPSIKDWLRLENNAAWIYNRRTYDEGAEYSLHNINTFRYAVYASCKGGGFYSQSAGLTFDAVFLDSTNDGNHVQLSFCLKETSEIKAGEHVAFVFPLALKTCGKNIAFVPKAGVKFSFEYADLIFDAYRMVQFPNMDDLYWSGFASRGNPDLKKEEGWGGEVTLNSKKYVPFSLCFFTNYYENKIQWKIAASPMYPENIASAFYAGVDFKTEKSFLDGILNVRFNAEYLYTRLLDVQNEETYGKRIMWTPDLTAALIFNIETDFISCSLEASYIGKRYLDNKNNGFMEPYCLLNASLSYKGFNHFTPYLRAENLLDAEYEAVDSYPMPGISVTAGLRTKF